MELLEAVRDRLVAAEQRLQEVLRAMQVMDYQRRMAKSVGRLASAKAAVVAAERL